MQKTLIRQRAVPDGDPYQRGAQNIAPQAIFDPHLLAADNYYTVAAAPSNAITYSGANLSALTTGRLG